MISPYPKFSGLRLGGVIATHRLVAAFHESIFPLDSPAVLTSANPDSFRRVLLSVTMFVLNMLHQFATPYSSMTQRPLGDKVLAIFPP
jgi:hypothetical protein